jgi:hypothetical protein
MIIGSGGYAYSMGGNVLCNNYTFPPKYNFSIGGSDQYTVGYTATFNNAFESSSQMSTAYTSAPLYSGSYVTAKFRNKSGYTYSFNISGLSATDSSRDSAYTYVSGRLTGDGGAVVTGSSLNRFSATARNLSLYQYGDTMYGGVLFNKTACTMPEAIANEYAYEEVKYVKKWPGDGSPTQFGSSTIQVSTFQPILSARYKYTANLPYRKATTGTDYMSYFHSYGPTSRGSVNFLDIVSSTTNPRTATCINSADWSTSERMAWWELFPRGDLLSTWYPSEFTISAILTGVLY